VLLGALISLMVGMVGVLIWLAFFQ
jgi:hypothetical protein